MTRLPRNFVLFPQDRFYYEGFVDSLHCVHSDGEFQGVAIVTCYDQQSAERFKRLYDHMYIAGSRLRVAYC